jgi:hypothetical protein
MGLYMVGWVGGCGSAAARCVSGERDGQFFPGFADRCISYREPAGEKGKRVVSGEKAGVVLDGVEQFETGHGMGCDGIELGVET